MSDFGNLLAYAEAQAGGAEKLQETMAKHFDAKYHAKEADKDKDEKPAPAKR